MKNLENLQGDVHEEVDVYCPFAPALCNKSRDIVDKLKIKKIQDRYEEDFKRKQEKIQKEKLESERKEMLTYQSQQIHRTDRYSSVKKSESIRNLNSINKNKKSFRKSLNRSRGSDYFGHDSQSPRKNIYESQKEWLEKRDLKILQMQKDSADKELMYGEEYSFVPHINKRSSSRIKMEFFDRQQMYKKNKEEKLDRLNKSTDDMTSFHPKINKNTSQLIESAQKRKIYFQSNLKDLEPAIGYHAVKTYVNEKQSNLKNSISEDPKLIKQNLAMRFKSAMYQNTNMPSTSEMMIKQEKIERAVEHALEGYNSTANKVLVGPQSRNKSRRESVSSA